MDSLRFTSHVEECSKSIAQGGEYETDADLSCLMKLQSLVEKQRLSGLWEIVDAQYSDTHRAPVAMLVKSCQVDLQNFKNSLSNHQLFDREIIPLLLRLGQRLINQLALFVINYYSAEIHLYEVCFKMPPTTGIEYSMESLHRMDIIYSCFESTRLFFEAFLSVPATNYCAFTIVNIGQMFHALGALYKLSVFDVGTWDVSKVRTTLDLSSVLNQIAMGGEQAGNSWGPREADNPWFFCGRKLRTLQSWWNAKLAQEAEVNASSEMAQDGTFDDLQAMINCDFLDDNFWK